MLNNILNLEGVTVLDKKQQGSVHGGGTCIIRGFNADGSVHGVGFSHSSSGSAEAETASAHQACAAAMNSGAASCFYDCQHDGFESL